ncbi:hypothetical protein SARC_04297 [Sphaeroforma arctica JP610]|uniref:CRAL-TRIO domain-containing protein n=1 Tax=Sphaeroforma arctica JP610 TaxID=667725 RepID=A0A0L0G3P0_9EUKA|nr:hypothetical protein SARC_04297 [Sphaeroforma arctica JP610]KNC83456.1 hypothetical protein SARC_04297 [Sphaeroforma arctica JP610]|eukprot:XP_014157358.1 hypothetical protein SARC_04297 [Sphaeroforma arctica JP610]
MSKPNKETIVEQPTKKFEAPPAGVAETNESRKVASEEILHAEAFKTLKAHIFDDKTLTDADKQFCTDACLLRYLRARDYHLERSEKLLRGTLKWRKEYWKNGALDPNGPLDIEAGTGKVLVHGLDRYKRPVLYLRPRLQNTTNYVEQNRLTVYMLERCIESMDASYGTEKLTLIIDFKEYSLRNAPPMAQNKEFMTILSEHYPERLGVAILVDAPMIFNMTYKLLQPFIPAETKKKVVFVSGSAKPGQKKHEVLSKYLHMNDVPAEYGGDAVFEYDHEHYWSRELSHYDSKRMSQSPLGSD